MTPSWPTRASSEWDSGGAAQADVGNLERGSTNLSGCSKPAVKVRQQHWWPSSAAQAETARELCYRLYTLCERKKRAGEAMAYNGLVQSWPEITRLARETPRPVKPGTDDLFDQE